MRSALERSKREEEHVKANKKRKHQTVDIGQGRHARTTEDVNGSLLLLLPNYLIFDILVRLPICTLLICKRVCNSLYNILSDPYFAELHLAKASRDGYSLVIQEVNDLSKIFLTPLIGLDKHAVNSKTNDHCDGKFFSWQTLTMPALIPKSKSYGQSAYLIGSCNGLLCLRYLANKVVCFCVCNPILGEFITLPQCMEFTCELGGFGFCPKTKQYKVLRFIPRFGYCDIITLGTDSDWRKVSDAPPHPERVVDVDSSYSGNLHWIVGSEWSKKSICSFNLETERYSYISLPSCFNNTKLHPKFYSLEIGTLDRLFCVSFMIVPGHFRVYVMEDYGLKESWIKRVSIDTGYNFGPYGGTRFLDSGILVLPLPTRLVYYDTRKRTTSDILVEGNFCAMGHNMSLISLKDIVRRENVEEVERKMLNIFSSKARRH